MPSDIQVFVRFKDESTFAGELIQCIITFKNVASISDNASDTNNWQPRGSVATRSIAERSPTDRSRGLSSQNPRQTAINSHGGRKTSNSGHRTTTSLTMPPTGSSVARPTPPSRPSHKHQRSVSILSLGSPNIGNEDIQAAKFPPKSRPTFNHGRSASLQVYPRKFDANYDGLSSCMSLLCH